MSSGRPAPEPVKLYTPSNKLREQERRRRTTLNDLPNELLLSISKDLSHDSNNVCSNRDRACLALVNHRFFNLLSDSAPFKPLQFPSPFHPQAECHAFPQHALPTRWQFLARLEQDSLNKPLAKRVLLCSDCLILHPASQFVTSQAAKPAHTRTCCRKQPRILREGVVSIGDCTCVKWTSLRSLKPATAFHETSTPISPTCTHRFYHTCSPTCAGFAWPQAKPLLNITMHLHEQRQSRAILEVTEYWWEDDDTAKVWGCYPALKSVRTCHGVPTQQTSYAAYGNPGSVNVTARCWFRACAGRHRTLVIQDPLGPEEGDRWEVIAIRQMSNEESQRVRDIGERM